MDIVAPALEAYAEGHTTPPHPALVALAQETRTALTNAGMMVGALEGRFLEMLVFAQQPRLVLEIGMFTGYSALSMAGALPEGGRIITCEINETHAEIARRHIEASPWADRIEIRMGSALDTVGSLDGPFDFVFIDADKSNYANYLDAVLPKLAPGGLIAVDNTLWSGRVIDDAQVDADTEAIRSLNDAVVADPGLVCVQVTVRDGVTLIRKA